MDPDGAGGPYNGRVLSPIPHAWTWIRGGLHLMTAVLLALVLLRAAGAEEGIRWGEVRAAAAVVVVYAVGMLQTVQRDRPRAVWWLVALVATWLWLLSQVPDGVFLAFPLFFLAAHMFSDRVAVAVVAVLTALAVGGYALHRGLSFGSAVGPVLGAVVALAAVLGLRAVDRQSAQRGVAQERERLAREIHDTLAQGLSSINLLLGAAQGRIPDGEQDGPVAALVGEARQVAVANLEEARRFVRALAPAALEGAGLVGALRRTVAEQPIASLVVEGEPRALGAEREAAVVRVVTEALTNAHKHSGADRVRVTLAFLDDQVRVDVVDDGSGFDRTRAASGFGLRSMRSRAAEVGGKLTVESTTGLGTAVGLTLPEPRGARR